MATINLGNIKFSWQGAYNGATNYAVDDVVSYNGSSYVCKLASTGNLPTDTTYWDQMSSAGTNGTNGTDLSTTLTTQGDLVYRDGSGLARLGAGTAGQLLRSGGAGANPSWIDVAGGKIKKTHWWWDDTQASIPDASSSGTGLQVANYTFTATSNNPHFILDFSFFLGINGTSNNDAGDVYCVAWIEKSGALVYPFGFKKTSDIRSGATFRALANQFFLEDTDAGQFSSTSSWGGDRRSFNGVMGNQATNETQPVASAGISAGDTLLFQCHLGGSGDCWYNRTDGATGSHSRSWFKIAEYDNTL